MFKLTACSPSFVFVISSPKIFTENKAEGRFVPFWFLSQKDSVSSHHSSVIHSRDFSTTAITHSRKWLSRACVNDFCLFPFITKIYKTETRNASQQHAFDYYQAHKIVSLGSDITIIPTAHSQIAYHLAGELICNILPVMTQL